MNGCVPWKSDGSNAGTARVKTIVPNDGNNHSRYGLYGNSGEEQPSDVLRVSDGTIGGTMTLREFSTNNGNSALYFIIAVNNTLYRQVLGASRSQPLEAAAFKLLFF